MTEREKTKRMKALVKVIKVCRRGTSGSDAGESYISAVKQLRELLRR